MTNQWQPPGAPGFQQQQPQPGPMQPGYQSPGQFPGMAPGAQPQYQQPPMQPGPGQWQPQQPAPQQYQQPPMQQGYGAPQGFQQPPQQPNMRVPSLAGHRAGNTNGRYLPPGEYVLDVDRVLVTQSQDGRGSYFVVEFTVVETDNAAVSVGDSTYSWARAFSDQYGYGPRDIKGWICEIVEAMMPGSNPRDQWDDGFIAWIAQEGENSNHPQPARGVRMRVSAFDKPNKKKAGSTTVLTWQVLPPGSFVGLRTSHSTAAAPVQQQQPPMQQQAPQWQAPPATMQPPQQNPYAQPQQAGAPQGFAPPPGMAPGVWGGQR